MGTQASRIRHEERGFVLTELAWVMVVGALVLWVPATLVSKVFVHSNTVTGRNAATSAGAVALERLARDMRQATAATVTDDGRQAVAVLELPRRTTGAVAAGTVTVTWTCTDGAGCTRATAGTTPRTEQILQQLADATFTATDADGAADSTNPAFVELVVAPRAANQEDADRSADVAHVTTPVALSEGVELRNLR